MFIYFLPTRYFPSFKINKGSETKRPRRSLEYGARDSGGDNTSVVLSCLDQHYPCLSTRVSPVDYFQRNWNCSGRKNVTEPRWLIFALRGEWVICEIGSRIKMPPSGEWTNIRPCEHEYNIFMNLRHQLIWVHIYADECSYFEIAVQKSKHFFPALKSNSTFNVSHVYKQAIKYLLPLG